MCCRLGCIILLVAVTNKCIVIILGNIAMLYLTFYLRGLAWLCCGLFSTSNALFFIHLRVIIVIEPVSLVGYRCFQQLLPEFSIEYFTSLVFFVVPVVTVRNGQQVASKPEVV